METTYDTGTITRMYTHALGMQMNGNFDASKLDPNEVFINFLEESKKGHIVHQDLTQDKSKLHWTMRHTNNIEEQIYIISPQNVLVQQIKEHIDTKLKLRPQANVPLYKR